VCGVVAAYNVKGASYINFSAVEKMTDMLKLRGPDDGNVVDLGHISLGHRRLSIVDIANGRQPMRNKNGTLHIVFNGEIYNHAELKSELVSRGSEFLTHSDTEVILNGYAVWGMSVFEKLDGMFSVIIWDNSRKELVVARDRYGIKPLYKKRQSDGTLLFASEISAIQSYSDSSSKKINNEALDNYLMLGFIVESRTLISGIEQVDIGTIEKYSLNSYIPTVKKYWCSSDVMMREESVPSDRDGLELLRSAVRSQSFADEKIEVGSFLSGGVDSSIITTLLGECHERKGTLLRCYTAGFNSDSHDETPLARNLASRLGAVHNSVYFGNELFKQINLLNDIYSGPFSDNAALPTYHVSALAKKDVKVLLSGDGADELFFGYRNHKSMLFESSIRKVMPSSFQNKVLPWLAESYPNSPKMPRFLRARSTLKALGMELGQAYCSAMSITSREVLESIYSKEFKSSLQGMRTEDDFRKIALNVENEDPMKIIQHIDFKTYLPGSILTKVDRATMAASLEARVPFLNNALVDRVLPISSHHNIGYGKNKSLLRNWASPILSKDVSMRVKKSFTSPLDTWFRALPFDEFRIIIMTEALIDSNIFDLRALLSLMDSHHRGDANHGTTLWSIAVLANSICQEGIKFNKERYANTLSPQGSF
jgi:asparagine synthase (glutamine-hydrolysing)